MELQQYMIIERSIAQLRDITAFVEQVQKPKKIRMRTTTGEKEYSSDASIFGRPTSTS